MPGATHTGRFGYTGQAWLPELNLWHYKARAYNPRIGRFLQTDPIGTQDQINLYAYVDNDPVNATDPSGLCNPNETDIVTVCGRPDKESEVTDAERNSDRIVVTGATSLPRYPSGDRRRDLNYRERSREEQCIANSPAFKRMTALAWLFSNVHLGKGNRREVGFGSLLSNGQLKLRVYSNDVGFVGGKFMFGDPGVNQINGLLAHATSGGVALHTHPFDDVPTGERDAYAAETTGVALFAFSASGLSVTGPQFRDTMYGKYADVCED